MPEVGNGLGSWGTCVHICPYMIRDKIIKIFGRIGIDKDAYQLLRIQKKLQKKSMAEIVTNLIKENFKGRSN